MTCKADCDNEGRARQGTAGNTGADAEKGGARRDKLTALREGAEREEKRT